MSKKPNLRVDKVYAKMGPYLDLCTVGECAKYLRVTIPRIRQFIRAGRLPARRMGKVWLILRDDLRDFAAIKRPKGRPSQEERENRGEAVAQFLERSRKRPGGVRAATLAMQEQA